MKITPQSTLKDIINTPVGSDRMAGVPSVLINNPVVGNIKLKTISKLSGKILPTETVDHICNLLNVAPEKLITKNDVEPRWWKESVIYQIYPRSFMDSNGDGIGDLQGIISKLDYLKELGVDVLWLSPIYDSPNDDMGYDIRDYRKIMTEFGTMDDFDQMLEEIHNRGMKLVMDLVVNHTSDEHEWFQKALAGDEKYKDYYIFRKGKGEGIPPNNWTSCFSGSAWNYYPELDEWALHLFSKKQMDLNWENPEMRKEVYEMVSWWLEKGVDGFRMDVVSFISKTDGLPDKTLVFSDFMHYFWGPKLHEYLRELNENSFKKFPESFCVGETPGIGVEMAKWLVDDSRDEIRQTFIFDHIDAPGKGKWDDYKYNLSYLKKMFSKYQLSLYGSSWPALVTENHDNARMVSKVNPDPRFRKPLSKLIGAMLLTGRGTPYIYQGEELGMINCNFNDISEMRDVEALNKYNELMEQGKTPEQAWAVVHTGSRDNSRTPICWDDSENAGFTTGIPWLRVNGDYKECNVKAQLEDETSTYHYYKSLMALRKEYKDTLVYGDFKPFKTSGKTFCFYRESKNNKFYVEMNLTENVIKRPFEIAAHVKCLLSNYNNSSDKLRPYEVNIYKVK